jgi:hypothetical protein
MYLLTTQTSTTLRLLTYTNTGNLASSSAPTLASQRTISSSISVGGYFNYGSSAQLANGQNIDGGDDRLIGLSFASGRLLASCTSYYGSTAATPKVRRRRRGKEGERKKSEESSCRLFFLIVKKFTQLSLLFFGLENKKTTSTQQ